MRSFQAIRLSTGNRYGLYDYYGVSYQEVYTPGYTVTDTIVKLDIVVFSVKTEQMIWSGATRSVNTATGGEITDEAGALVIKDMKKAGLL